MKTAYRDGTTHIVLEPLDFIARLAALVPPPRLLMGLAAPSEHDGEAELDRARHAAAEAALHEMARGHSDAGFYAEAAGACDGPLPAPRRRPRDGRKRGARAAHRPDRTALAAREGANW